MLANSWGEAEEAYIGTGVDENLDETMKQSVRDTSSPLTQILDHEDACSLVSIGIDYEVSQVVDLDKSVHAMMYKGLFPDCR